MPPKNHWSLALLILNLDKKIFYKSSIDLNFVSSEDNFTYTVVVLVATQFPVYYDIFRFLGKFEGVNPARVWHYLTEFEKFALFNII